MSTYSSHRKYSNKHSSKFSRELLQGIVSWGCTSNVDQLDVQGENVHYCHSKNDGKGLLSLEPNHTHFVFIDDGSKYKHGCALKYRGQFERVILNERFSILKTNDDNQQQQQIDRMPIVVVVMEGCADAIKKGLISKSLMNHRENVLNVHSSWKCG